MNAKAPIRLTRVKAFDTLQIVSAVNNAIRGELTITAGAGAEARREV